MVTTASGFRPVVSRRGGRANIPPVLDAGGDPLSIQSAGMILSRNTTSLFGRYVGWTCVGTDTPYRLQAVQFEITPSRAWSAPR